MTILALDLGTTTGWAYGTALLESEARIKSGTWSLKPGRYEGAGMRGVRFMAHLDELHRASPLKQIVFEAVARHVGHYAGQVYGGLMGVLQTWCELNSVPYDGVPVGTIKRFWTGKGNTKKDGMIAECVRRGFAPKDDNESDALALLHYQMEGANA